MNTKMTKIKKSYVAFATLIALMGVIFALVFTTNSFAEESNEDVICTFIGSAIDGNNTAIPNADVNIRVTDVEAGQTRYLEGTTNSSGNFSIDTTIDDTKEYTLLDIHIHRNASSSSLALAGSVWYQTQITSTTCDLGAITCSYQGHIDAFINGQDTEFNIDKQWHENQYGHWKSSYIGSVNSTDLDFIYSSKAEYNISDNNIIIDYYMGTGGADKLTQVWEFVPNAPYTFSSVSVTPIPFEESNATGITTNIKIEGSIGEQKHAVTIGDNISSVKTADGTVITSGDKVAHGTTLYVTPLTQDGHVSKIRVNGEINSTGVVVANSDVNISATVPEAVTISGLVTADDSVANGNKDFAEFFVEKAYAAEVGVEGATVSFTSTDGWNTSTLTDNQGAYALDVEKGMGGVLTISKEGFNTVTKELSAEELQEDVLVSSALVKATQPQTGDVTIFAFVFIALVLSGAVVLRMSRRPKGLHIK